MSFVVALTIILAFLLVLAVADFARWWVRFFLDRFDQEQNEQG